MGLSCTSPSWSPERQRAMGRASVAASLQNCSGIGVARRPSDFPLSFNETPRLMPGCQGIHPQKPFGFLFKKANSSPSWAPDVAGPQLTVRIL